MRPALGAYNNTEVVTPRMDALAQESTLFSRAFCQEAWCSPSRNSFLTGRAPDTTQAWNFEDSFRVVGGVLRRRIRCLVTHSHRGHCAVGCANDGRASCGPRDTESGGDCARDYRARRLDIGVSDHDLV